jgi:outer membrane receptor protein involved in Fe transport
MGAMKFPASVFTAFLLLFGLLCTGTSHGQTFRGGISGTVSDGSGAVVPGAQVTAIDAGTNTVYKAVSSSAGEFSLSNLPLGDYSVTVEANGFSLQKVKGIKVTASQTYVLPVKLGVASAAATVEVTADAISLDTQTDEQATVLPEAVVQDLPNAGRDFTQMLAQTTGFAGLSTGGGMGMASVNGSRSNSINWEIEGTDNNDLWWNNPAVNQGGVSALAGVIMPIDAIDNFSFVTAGSTEIGRNSGGTANLTIKAGTNTVHGSAYYFNHNEYFQAQNPLESSKPATRDQHYGFSVGAPILHDKTFFFLSGEHEVFLLGAGTKATEPSAAYQADALAVLQAYGVPENPVSVNLLNGANSLKGLWPTAALTGSDSPDNYAATGNITGHSFNGVLKLDEQLTDKDHLSFTWFVGQGTQTAPLSSELAPYFENAPIHVQNYSLVYNRVLGSNITNQLAAGVSYYNQAFSDAETDFNPVGLGLDLYGGATPASLAGSPKLVIGATTASDGLAASGSGFDPIGITPSSGRNDITGHLDDDLTWTKGAHQMHFGGEIRQAQVDDFYQTGKRGTLYFDASQGPWATTGSACAALGNGKAPYTSTSTDAPSDGNVLYLADFLAGCADPSQSEIVQGDPKRQIFVNTTALYGQDSWQATKRLSLNFGARYDYEGPLHSDFPNLSVFDPTMASGLAVAGQDVSNVYKKFWGGLSPRVGFSYQADKAGKTVMRGGFGLYGDSIFLKSILQNNGVQNISVFGPEFNPAGSSIVVQAAGNGNVLAANQPVFQSYAQALSGQGMVKISTINPNFRPAYTQSIDLNVQHSFTPSIIGQVGYVGTKGTHLLGLQDINPAAPNATGSVLDSTRPYATKFPNFSVIDELESNQGSNYNSLQASLRVQAWHNLDASAGYTWGHALDYETGEIPYVAQNPLNEKGEYGNADFDVRQTLTGYLNYTVPHFAGPSRLVDGWEINSGYSFHGGTPYTVTSNSNPSNNGESADRAVQVIKNPTAGVDHSIQNGIVQWFNPNAFVDAAQGTYSPTRRNQNFSPGYSAVDIAILKNTKVNERVKAQFRADIFNAFNHVNLAPVGFDFASEAGVIGSTLGPYLGNPGIGPGEPRCAQFSLKMLF